jgi:hypothetical protein
MTIISPSFFFNFCVSADEVKLPEANLDGIISSMNDIGLGNIDTKTLLNMTEAFGDEKIKNYGSWTMKVSKHSHSSSSITIECNESKAENKCTYDEKALKNKIDALGLKKESKWINSWATEKGNIKIAVYYGDFERSFQDKSTYKVIRISYRYKAPQKEINIW